MSGWSYGAGLTLWMIEQRHDWRAAVAGAAVTDIAADYATADDIAADRALVGGSPLVGDRAARSGGDEPDHVRRARAHAAAADDVPRRHARLAGRQRTSSSTRCAIWARDVRLVAYPVDGHFPSDPVRRTDVYRRWVGFIAERFAT